MNQFHGSMVYTKKFLFFKYYNVNVGNSGACIFFARFGFMFAFNVVCRLWHKLLDPVWIDCLGNRTCDDSMRFYKRQVEQPAFVNLLCNTVCFPCLEHLFMVNDVWVFSCASRL